MVLHRDKDVQVEAVVRLPEEEDEDEADDTGAGEAPVQPRQLCIGERQTSLGWLLYGITTRYLFKYVTKYPYKYNT